MEREIDRTEIYIADEVFLCGTGVQIAAVTKVEHRTIGSGRMGEITASLHHLYHAVVSGHIEKYSEWLSPVYQKERVS